MIDETNLFGLLAVVLGFFSLQFQKRKNILMCLFASSGAFCLHYLLNDDEIIAGFAINAILAFRNLAYSNRAIKILKKRIVPCIFSVMLVCVDVFAWHGIFTVLLIIGHVVSTFGLHLKHTKHIRLTFLCSSPFLLIHEFLNFSWGGALFELVMIMSAAIGLFRMRGDHHNR